jgi:hypothetical protein
VIESFVDLTYRGLALGRRIKLTQVRPTTGYLELPMPMPVGTLVALTTDEGVSLEAVVMSIHEQIGGSERVPGMTVKPSLAGEGAQSWWQARVALPEDSDGKQPTRDRPITVRPRTHTVPTPPSEAATREPEPLTKEVTATKELSVFVAEQPQPLTTEVTATKELSVFVAEQPAPLPVAAPPPPTAPQYDEPPPRPKIKEEDIKRTMVMNAVDQELLAKLTAGEGEVEHLVRSTGEHAVVDDGLRTTVMDAVDPAALGLEVSASGSFRVADVDADGDDEDASTSKPNMPAQGGPSKKKKKKRR